MFRKTNILVFLLVALAGCATQTTYHPADKRGDDGYTDTKLTDTRYRVTFTGNSNTPSETVKDHALLRAAELTLSQGYDWFQLADRETDREVSGSTSVGGGVSFAPTTHAYQRCGLVSCNTATTYSGMSTAVGIGTTTASTAYSSALEIVLGKYPMPTSVESYDAQQLASTLRRLMKTGS